MSQAEIAVPAAGGLYLLMINLRSNRRINIGVLGEIDFTYGTYAYIGSAHGPGGLAARLRRHTRPIGEKRVHWHIDRLLREAPLTGIGWSTRADQVECEWAGALVRFGDRQPPRFGASDCRCAGHLIRLQDEISMMNVIQMIPVTLKTQESRTGDWLIAKPGVQAHGS